MKTILLNVSLLVLSLFSIGAFSSQVCAETPATASFNLVAPQETLKITQATDVLFKDATIATEDVVTTNSKDVIIGIQELSGEATGWKLAAKLSDFTGSNKGKKLTGAQLFYPEIIPTTTTSGDISMILPVSEKNDQSFNGKDNGKIVSSGADAVTIVRADVGKGYGSWTMTYPSDKVQLNIPTGNLKDTYTATLTYTLADTP